jgi:hypothetical protein
MDRSRALWGPRKSFAHREKEGGTLPGEGRKPTILQKLAGMRSDPPKSFPSPKGQSPAAMAAAVPALDPPLLKFGFQGFLVIPNTLLKVDPPAANSGVLVFPLQPFVSWPRRIALPHRFDLPGRQILSNHRQPESRCRSLNVLTAAPSRCGSHPPARPGDPHSRQHRRWRSERP